MSTTNKETSLDERSLLGLTPSSAPLLNYLKVISAAIATPDLSSGEVKCYSDAVYFNYHALGLSLLFKPSFGYKPKIGTKRADLQNDKLLLDGIDIYNPPKLTRAGVNASSSGRSAEVPFSSYPIQPFTLTFSPEDKDGKSRPDKMEVLSRATGKDFVDCLGEPDRKGGGSGPSSGSIDIWCEWSKDGIMVEFGGDEARGPQAWERGKDAVWKVITVFPPKA